jgi:hypothetical protein
MRFDRRRHDFGVAKQLQTLTTEFTLTNDGDGPLAVNDVRGDCGCIATAMKHRTLAPGASEKIVVTYHTHMVAGRHTKHVRVATDDPETPNVALEVTVDVSGGVLLDPAHFYFALSLVGSSPAPRAVAKWKPGVGQPFRVTRVDVEGVDMVAETKEWEAKDFKGWEIELRFRKPPPIGQISGKAVIHTDSPETPSISALIGGQITGRVWIAQRQASVGAVTHGKGATLRIPVRAFNASIALGEVTARSRRGRVAAKAVRDPATRDLWNVEIRLPEDAAVGPVEDVVEITTEVEGEEIHFVEVGGIVMPKPAK